MTDVYFAIIVRRTSAPYQAARFHLNQVSYDGIFLTAPRETTEPSIRVRVPAEHVEAGRALTVCITPFDPGEHVLAVYGWPRGEDDPTTAVDERWALLTDPVIRGKGDLTAKLVFPQ